MSKILIRDPFAEFDGLFQSAFGRHGRRHGRHGRHSHGASSWQLPVNVFETDEGVGIEAWLPGFSEDEIAVTVDDGQLQIRAKRSSDESSEGGGEDRTYRRREVSRTVLSRSFRLDPSYDAEAISASLENGVLELSLPKTAQAEPHRVAIKSGISGTAEVSDEDDSDVD